MVLFIVTLFFLNLYSQTYYVTATGSDSQSCGDQSSPCASINQVLTNYPETSCTLSIGAGKYPTTTITLEGNALVVFQGTSYPSIIASWRSGYFLSITRTSGFEFHDLSIILDGGGYSFVMLDNYSSNVVNFYNVALFYSDFSGCFIDSHGSFVFISNTTFVNASFDNDQFFISDVTYYIDSNVTITGSMFANLTFGKDGGLVAFVSPGSSNLIINSSTLSDIDSQSWVLCFMADDLNKSLIITNSMFQDTYSYYPCVYVEADRVCVVYISDSSFNSIVGDYYSGALGILGPEYDSNSCAITLNNLTFKFCSGDDAGAVLVEFSSVNISGSNFVNNYGINYGNDFVHEYESSATRYVVNITNSYSQSDLPKAAIYDYSTGTVTDISDQLPTVIPPNDPLINEIASVKLGHKFKKY